MVINTGLWLPAIITLILLGLVTFWHRFLRKDSKFDVLYQLPGPQHYPLIGTLLSLPTNQTEVVQVLRSWCEMSPMGMVFTSVAKFCLVTLYSAETVEAILTSRSLLDKGSDYDLLRPWLRDGLLTSTGAKWHSRRKLITPAFHFGILDQFLEVMNEQSVVLVERLVESGPGPLDVWPYVSDMTLDVIAEAAMGVGVGAQAGTTSKYKTAIQQIGHVVHMRSMKPWLRNDTVSWLTGWEKLQNEALAVLHDFSQAVIDEKRRFIQENGIDSEEDHEDGSKKRRALLDILLSADEEGNTLTDDEITEEVDTFMFEGHDTTASGINWALYNVARFPDVQQRIHQELDELFGDSLNLPSREELGKLKYLECVIKESMRLFPPVTFYSRLLPEDVDILGYKIPQGTDVLIFPHMVHRDPRHWPNPETFNPERFTVQNSTGRHPFCFVPFSAGVRNCIGQKFAMLEMKSVLVALLRRFNISTKQQYSERMLRVSLTLQKEGPLEIDFRPRSSKL